MNGDGKKAKADVQQVLDRSVVEPAPASLLPASSGWLLFLTQVAPDAFPVWGSDVKRRDQMLRDFITKESFFASALATVQARNAAMRWTVKGSPRTMEVCKQMLLQANFGAGWEAFISALTEDLSCQDSGAFVATPHASDSEDSPVIGIHTLDAARCWPTGNPDFPVIYLDRLGKYHQLRPFEIFQLLELAAAPESGALGPLYRLQRCALTRFLETAQRMRNQAIYMKEKTGGRFQRQIHLVQGVPSQKIEDAIKVVEEEANAQGLSRFIKQTIVGGVDADTPVDVKTIQLAGLPDGFNEKEWMGIYYTAVAMAFLTDVQEFAPLPGSNLGTSTQSEMLHQKSTGRGPALFRNIIANLINWHVFPDKVEFVWEERDIQAEREEAEAFKLKAEGITLLTNPMNQVISPEAARQWLLDEGILPQEIFDMMGSTDVTPDTVTDADSKPQQEQQVGTQVVPEAGKAKGGPTTERLAVEKDVAEAIAVPLGRIGKNVRKRLRGSE